MATEITTIKETCLYVSNLDDTAAFYHGLLGLEVISMVSGRHVFFRVGSGVLLCFIAEVTRNETVLPPHYATGKQHLAFEVPREQYNLWKKKLTDNEVPITHEQRWKEGISSFYFEDPDGHVLEILPPGVWE